MCEVRRSSDDKVARFGAVDVVSQRSAAIAHHGHMWQCVVGGEVWCGVVWRGGCYSLLPQHNLSGLHGNGGLLLK